MDDLLNGPQFWASELGAKPSRFGGSLLADLVEFGGSWSACNGDESGFTGEVPYSGNRSALELMMMGVAGERETSLVRMHADQPHPLLGSGLLMRTQLPVEIDGDGEMIAIDLNRREASGAAPCKLLGAWCVADDSLHHVSFVPSLLARPGLLQNLYVDSAVRSAWAHEVLGR